MQKFAKEKGGRCLSKRYVNSHSKLLWKCQRGHTWKAMPISITRGSWCQRCGWISTGEKNQARILGHKSHLDAQREMLRKARKIARVRGGRLLSGKYNNNSSSLSWRCENRHIWKAKYANVVNGNWCPYCTKNYGEKIVREIFEKVTGREFHLAYPKWLKNGDGNQLQLDGYNESLRIAFEHQGKQHFQALDVMGGRKGLLSRLRNDRIKKQLCKRKMVSLLIIKSVPQIVSVDEAKKIILDFCQRHRVSKVHKVEDIKINFNSIYGSDGEKILSAIENEVRKMGGRIIDRKYHGWNGNISFKCRSGHTWSTRPKHILNGSWCPVCAGKVPLGIQLMLEIANQRGGACLSTGYKNAHTSLKWQCGKGHMWYAPAMTIRRGAWCAKCAGVAKLSIEDMKVLAKRNGGQCLSKKYFNVFKKIKWKCGEGHIFVAMPASVRRGSWCPICRRGITWTKPLAVKAAKKYKSRSELKKNAWGGWDYLRRAGLLDQVMPKSKTRKK